MQLSRCMQLGAWPAATRKHCDFFELLKVYVEALWQFCRQTVANRRRPGRPVAPAVAGGQGGQGPKTTTKRMRKQEVRDPPREMGKVWARILMSTWRRNQRNLVRSLVVVVVVVGVGGLPRVLLLLIQGSMTAGRTGFTFRLPLRSHFLLSLLVW